jgi:hypothetical protein
VLVYENDLYLSVIAAGGSQGVFFKINTLSEGSFANKMARIVEQWETKKASE